MRVGAWDATLIELSLRPLPAGSPLFDPSAVVEGQLELALNVMLLQSGEHALLVDPGTGILGDWFPAMGDIADLDEALERAGTSRERIELVVSTHLDPDHAGGLVAGGWPDDLRPAFPNARVVALEPELRRYRERDPQAPRNAGTPALAALERAGVVDVVSDGAEVAPGVRVRLAAGHSPGHAIVEVDGDPPLVFVTDTVHTVAHVEHPEWGRADQDVAEALQTRRRVLSDLAERGALAWGAHIPGPAPGRVQRAGDGFRWIAAA